MSDLHVDLTASHASVLASALPGWPPGLLDGSATLHITGAGDPGALGLSIQARLGDLRAEATGAADLTRQNWTGRLDLQHPGAPRLLAALGVPGATSWLGEGSFSLATTMAIGPGRVALRGFKANIAELRMSGDLGLDRTGATPLLTGQIDAETLPLPMPDFASAEPLPVAMLQGWRAVLAVKAGAVTVGFWPPLHDAAATLSLADGSLRVTGLTAGVAGGTLTGGLDLVMTGTPHLALRATLDGATISGPLLGGSIDIASGRLNGSTQLTASGFSLGTLLATLAGAGQAVVTDGVLTGVDMQRLAASLGEPDADAAEDQVELALQAGATSFRHGAADFDLHAGIMDVRHGLLATASGRAALSGTVDLAAGAADMRIDITPAPAGAPVIGLRLIGPVAMPLRTPELASLAGWLAAR